MHEKCAYYVKFGSIYNRYNDSFMLDEDISVLLDFSTGTFLKVGKTDMVNNYYSVVIKAYSDSGFKHAGDGLKVVTFKIRNEELGFTPDGYNFNIDEVCTLLNWLSNSTGSEKMNWFFNLSLEDSKLHIERLMSLGF